MIINDLSVLFCQSFEDRSKVVRRCMHGGRLRLSRDKRQKSRDKSQETRDKSRETRVKSQKSKNRRKDLRIVLVGKAVFFQKYVQKCIFLQIIFAFVRKKQYLCTQIGYYALKGND